MSVGRSFIVLVFLLLSACGTVHRDRSVPIVAFADLDAARYAGTWYEIARFPVPFQRGCTATTASYGVIDDRTLSVLNQCRQGTPDGPLRSIGGRAEIVGPGVLRVSFSTVPLIRAPYWVLWVDKDYETAVVGVPNGRAGWILARTPEVDINSRRTAEQVLRDNGYDTSRLLTVPH